MSDPTGARITRAVAAAHRDHWAAVLAATAGAGVAYDFLSSRASARIDLSWAFTPPPVTISTGAAEAAGVER